VWLEGNVLTKFSHVFGNCKGLGWGIGIGCRTFWVYFVDYDCARNILQEALDGLAGAAQVQKGANPSCCPGSQE